MSDSGNIPHIAILPSAGMGHLLPLLRLTASLATNHNCKLTIITIHPTVSLSESQLMSRFLSSFPQITPKQFNLLPLDPSTANSKDHDPFFLHVESIRRSAHLLSQLLSSLSSPPLSSVITDITLASAVLPITSQLHLSNYIYFISSAKMLSLCAYYPKILESSSVDEIKDYIEIPGSSPIPKSWLPPVLFDLDNLFTTQFLENGRKMVESNGILINTFEDLERETVAALNDGKVVDGFPPVIPIGPLESFDFEKASASPLKWLDGEQKGSVVYVSFGSRSALCREQIRELGVGLVRSGCRFVWVVKDKVVDREEEENLEVVLGKELMEGIKEKGLIFKEWVKQDDVLGHPSVGGFLSHSGWNSITEAAWHGVPILAWPLGGDQRMNAAVLEKSGFGVWVKSWGWVNEGVVKGEEIGERIREMMNDEGLRLRAAHVRDEARKAKEVDGSSQKGLSRVIRSVVHERREN